MTQDLQLLLESIQRDGVDKARAQADAVLNDAHKQATDTINQSQEKAQKIIDNARQQADVFVQRSLDTVRQAARNLLLETQQEITAQLQNVLSTEVNTALTNSNFVAELAEKVVVSYLKDGEKGVQVAVGAASGQIVAHLRQRLSQQAASGDGLTVEIDKTGSTAATGFKIRLDGGRIEHDVTADAIATSIGQHVRPQLAELLIKK